MLEGKQSNGQLLDDQQIAKLQTKSTLENALVELGFPPETESRLSYPVLSDGKGNKKADLSRKQRRKNKQRAAQSDVLSLNRELCEEQQLEKEFSDIKILQITEEKEEVQGDATNKSGITEDCSFDSPKGISKSFYSNKTSQSKPSKKKNRKGGLSMFLSGALDDTPRHAPPPVTPKSEGPAWGGVKITKGLTSLREIQNEQSKTKEMTSIKSTDRSEDPIEPVTSGQIQLSSFLPEAISRPIAVVPVQKGPASEAEKSMPPWSSAGTPPFLCRPSLRGIQMQQEKKQQSLSHSPKTRISGFLVSSQFLPSEPSGQKHSVPNRWFKPETDAPSSIRSIQIEEKAMKDLKRFYSNVKLVKSQPQPL